MGESPNRLWLVLIALVGWFCATLWAFGNPPLESPDEPDHLGFINYVAQTGELPVQLRPATQAPEGHQNPLYYYPLGRILKAVHGPIQVTPYPNPRPERGGPMLVAVGFKGLIDRNLFYALRSVNCILVFCLVLAIGGLARDWINGHAQLIPPLMVALLPQVSFLGGAINNDILNALMAAIALRMLLRAERIRHWFWAGGLCGLAFVAKKSSLILAPVGLLLSAATKNPRKVIAFGLGAGIFIGLIFFRNWVLYHDPLATKMETTTYAHLVRHRKLSSLWFNKDLLELGYKSWVGIFGWMQIRLSDRAYAIWVATLLPMLVAPVRINRKEVYASILVFGLSCLGLMYYNLTFSQPQGRLLWTALAPLYLLVGIGYEEALGDRGSKIAIGVLILVLGWLAWQGYSVNQAFYVRPYR